MTAALYELAIAHRALGEQLADLWRDPQTITDTLEGEAGALESKAVAVAMVARNLDALADSIKSVEADMSARRKALQARADHLRNYLLTNMQVAHITKIDCPHFCIAIKGKPASVDIFDAAQLPAEYMRTQEPPPPAPDKAAIASALKLGQDVPGARLTTDNVRLEIK